MNANAPRMNSDIDHTIDRALSALRDAQPRSGLEGRILTSLEYRAIAPQTTRFHLSAHIALWAATSAAILAVASMMILHHRSLERSTQAVILSAAQSAPSKDPEATSRASNPEAFSTTDLAQTSIEPTHRMAHRLTMPEACAQPRCTTLDGDAPGSPASSARWGGSPTVMDGVSQTPTEAQAFADLHAPSHPAPPSTLTQQEKLLLHMLRYGNATQLAELNPAVRAQHDADETTAFKAFFPDPPPVQQPGDTE